MDQIENTLPSNKYFGRFFFAIFLILSIIFFDIKLLAIIFLIISILFLLAAEFYPESLDSLNRLWYKLGLLLGSVISPIVMGGIYFFLITPVSLIQRFFGRDLLLLKKKEKRTYWIESNKINPESFKDQF